MKSAAGPPGIGAVSTGGPAGTAPGAAAGRKARDSRAARPIEPSRENRLAPGRNDGRLIYAGTARPIKI